jgi:hypothetical protein
MSCDESTEPLVGSPITFDVGLKVVGEVNDVGWKQLIVLTKPIAKPMSGADEIDKFRLRVRRGSLEYGFLRVKL